MAGVLYGTELLKDPLPRKAQRLGVPKPRSCFGAQFDCRLVRFSASFGLLSLDGLTFPSSRHIRHYS